MGFDGLPFSHRQKLCALGLLVKNVSARRVQQKGGLMLWKDNFKEQCPFGPFQFPNFFESLRHRIQWQYYLPQSQ